MVVFPAIDLIAGKVVRLRQGVRDAVDVYDDDPVGVAQRFAEAGARWVHVVDLSAAFGEDRDARAKNARAIRSICAIGSLRVDAGGGVRSLDDIARLAEVGVSRIALGTALVRDAELAHAAVESYGDLVVADIAARDGVVRVNGWQDAVPVALDEFVSGLAALGWRHMVFTDVARDGMQTGVDAQAYRRVATIAGFPVVASGGVATLEDLRTLAALGPHTLEGIIIGRALYEHAFTLEEALSTVKETSQGHGELSNLGELLSPH